MYNPFFTVIIPTYNRSHILKGAIQSVIDQTFKDFEVIVIDDHSSDDTREIVESFKDNRIEYVLNDRNKGGAGTRNCGIFRAAGQWVAFLDDDDTWLPDKLRIQYEKINNIDDLTGLVYSGYKYKSSRKRWDGHTFTPIYEGRLLDELLYDNYIGALCTVVVRTDILKEIGGFDERFRAHQDLDLYVRIAVLTKIAYVTNCLATVNLHSENRITLNYEKKLEACLLFWKKHESLINRRYKNIHRAASRVFVFAVALGKITDIRKSLPWLALGLFIDPKNFIWAIRSTVSMLLKSRLQRNQRSV